MVLLKAAARGDERSRRFRGALTANLMNCWVKRGHQVHVDDLVGPPYGRKRLSGGMAEGREEWLARCRAARAEKQGEQGAAANATETKPGPKETR